jgi:hypothetical protein
MTQEELLRRANEETDKAVPWQCWDIPGFKACHTEAGHQTYRELVDGGHAPGSPLYLEFYPKLYRNAVFDCQRKFACTYDTLKDMQDAANRHNQLAFPETSRAWVAWLAVAGACGVGFWWYRKQKGTK